MFSFRGVDLDALLDMSTDEVVKLFTIRARRRFQRGLTHKPMALIKKLRKAIPCYFHSKYKSKIFSTYTDIGTSCKIPYGHGSIYRFFSQDVVKVGDIVIKDQVSILPSLFYFISNGVIKFHMLSFKMERIFQISHIHSLTSIS
ncbi:uncharacterized protein LOC107646641 isoform X2 [Arachis ipaensis]|uniref:uncharacterized protein LOC107646641 isoform X2 n=1 Tax=Arachis ipaensis TaxID=130454 RepID=UPI000A2B2534|nr:uncharacterized protein LOC107646641 isoform X2 [Arachis ipaensis]